MNNPLTDRAYRYRANAAMPAGEKRCNLCGNPGRVEVGHVDGHEENTSEENLIWTCRSCNILSGNYMRRHGAGRLTRQYNPSRSKAEGAKNLTQWVTAIGAIGVPHGKPGDLSPGDMTVAEGVAMIHATSKSTRKRKRKRL